MTVLNVQYKCAQYQYAQYQYAQYKSAQYKSAQYNCVQYKCVPIHNLIFKLKVKSAKVCSNIQFKES